MLKKIVKYKDNIKKTWGIIKKIIGKTRTKNSSLPEKLTVDRKNILDKKEIANKFHNLITFL